MSFLTKIFGAVDTIETTVIGEIAKVENVVVADVKSVFEKARTEALVANGVVNALKADLQTALAKARDLHEVAIKAAAEAQAAAEADVAKFKAAIVAHTADKNTQASQVVAPTPVTAADLSGNGVTATITTAQ